MKLRDLLFIVPLTLIIALGTLATFPEVRAQDTQEETAQKAETGKAEKKTDKEKLSLDQVLSKYYEAIGGLEKWRGLNTMVMKGELNSQGATMPVTAYHARPNKCRVEYKLKDTMMAQIFSGVIGWQINPLSGNPEPAPMTNDKTIYLRDTCGIEGSLIDYKKKGYKVEFLGKEDLDGQTHYKVTVKYQSGNIETMYIDADTFLINRATGIFKMGGQDLRISTIYKDYKNTDGFVVPYKLIFEIHGAPGLETLNINKILFNTKVDPDIFEFPKDKIINYKNVK